MSEISIFDFATVANKSKPSDDDIKAGMVAGRVYPHEMNWLITELIAEIKSIKETAGVGTGPAGATGPAGSDGSVGADGATGATGTQGAVGATGAAGTNGTDGLDGADGIDGATGATGATGPEGPVGPTGPEASEVTTLSQAIDVGYDHYYEFKSDNLVETPDLIGDILLDYAHPATPDEFTSPIVEDSSVNAASLQIDPTSNNNAQFHGGVDYVANATFVIKVGEQPVAHYSRHLFSTNNNGAIYILENDSHADANKLNFYNNLPAGSPVIRIQSDSGLVNGENYVITLQWNGVETAMFIDGVKQAETVNTNLFLGAWYNLAGDNNVDYAFAGVLDLAMFSANGIPDNDVIAWHNTLMAKIL